MQQGGYYYEVTLCRRRRKHGRSCYRYSCIHKYQVDTVYDGEEALEYARKEITRTIIMLSEEPQQSVKQQNEPPVQPDGNTRQ